MVPDDSMMYNKKVFHALPVDGFLGNVDVGTQKQCIWLTVTQICV